MEQDNLEKDQEEENQAKELVKEEVKAQVERVEEEFKAEIIEIEKRFQDRMEEQFEKIREELSNITSTANKLENMEEKFRFLVEKELNEIKKEISTITASKEKIEGELSDRWNILVKLRSQTYDKLMEDYKKVEKKLLLRGKESKETDEPKEQPESTSQ